MKLVFRIKLFERVVFNFKKIIMLSDGKERYFYGVKLVIDGIII